MVIGGRGAAPTDAASATIMELEGYFQSQLKKYGNTSIFPLCLMHAVTL
jgi:hypothetical protein